MTDKVDPTSEEFDEKAWARSILGIPEEEPASRGDLFRQLREYGFLPPLGWSVALRVLTEADSADERRLHPSFDLLQIAEERFLRQKVDCFCGEFFRLPVDARVSRWRNLCRECREFPVLSERLQHLIPALRARIPKIRSGQPFVEELTEKILEIVVTPPAHQGYLRREVIAEAAENPAEWGKAARRVLNSLPQGDVFDAPLLRRIGRRFRLRRNMERLRAKMARPKDPTVEGLKGIALLAAGGFIVILLIIFLPFSKSDRKLRKPGAKPKVEDLRVPTAKPIENPGNIPAGLFSNGSELSQALQSLDSSTESIPSRFFLGFCVELENDPRVFSFFDADCQDVIRKGSANAPLSLSECQRLENAVREIITQKDSRGASLRNLLLAYQKKRNALKGSPESEVAPKVPAVEQESRRILLEGFDENINLEPPRRKRYEVKSP